MSLSEHDIEYVAKLARISIDQNDLNDFADDLSVCLDYFALIIVVLVSILLLY